ncbi:Sulfate transporter 1.3 [Morella rubra]|uniref:Sulfate transporter 1.3 n=1 Tax=Morella rubra TaxID=262757 RepID=A0A6A1V0N9_9ROSI|nr:Sulfate transporter 1.3 [Morella rubra]
MPSMGHSSDEGLEAKEVDARSLSSSHHQKQNMPYVHKVGVPQKQNLFQEFKASVKETFFADDPLSPFKDQTKSRKFILGIQAIFPIFDWGRRYNLTKFRGDIIAGLTIASLCIPQDIGYAKLANLAPQYGLYSSFVPPLIYAFMGSSRDMVIGPVSVVSLLLGTLLQNEFDPTTNATEYRRLAFTATFFAGITQVTLGFFRLGFLIDFLSHAAIVGFMGGAAITIALQQLKGFLGIKTFTKKSDLISVMHSVWGSVNHGWNWQTIVIGATFLSFLLFTKYIGKRNKKLFWVPAIAPLISVILSTFFVYITHAEEKGVAIVKHIEKGINPSSVNEIYFSGENLGKGFRIGVVAAMVALTEAVAIGRTFASMKDYQIDGNKEMVALGAMNVVGSMTSCYVATGSFSRSAVNYMAGCQTAVSNIVMSCVVFLTLEFITPLFKYTPNAILSAIIISAVINLVSISFAKILLQVTRPNTATLGNIPGTTVYRNIRQYPDATKVPGILIVRVDSAIYFSNSNYIKERILRWLTDEEGPKKAAFLPRFQFLIVEMSPVTDIDTSGIRAFEELHGSLMKRDVQLILANPGPAVIDKLHASNFVKLIGEDRIFLTVADAVSACSPFLV